MNSKYRKIKYSPGLISLFMLPTLCILYLQLNNFENNLSGIEIHKPIICFTDENTNLQLKDISTARSYFEFVIDNNEEQTKLKLDSARSLLKYISELQDTINGIHFEFKPNSKYWAYIEAQDICMYNKSNLFLNASNNIWVLQPKAAKNDTTEPPVWNCVITNEEINASKSSFAINITSWDNIKRFTLLFWPSIILFFAMVIFSYRNLSSIKKAACNPA